MNELVLGIAAGKRCKVEAVEALLLLAEWEPQSFISNWATTTIGPGDEDNAARMHIGMAIRLAYLLRLDRKLFQKRHRGTNYQLSSRTAGLGR
jgi:hypothetical protein